MATVGVILNPQAGGNAGNRARLAEFAGVVGANGLVELTGSLPELPDAARRIAERNVDVLAVCGGDGSFFHALSACVPLFGDRLPYFLPLPAGSMNTIASSLGCPRRRLADTLAMVVAATDLRRSCRIVERELIRINGSQYGFMVGAGVIANFLEAYYAEPARGPRAAARLVARLAGSIVTRGELARRLFATVEGQVRCDGKVLPWNRFSAIYAATVTELGLGFRIAYRAGTTPGKFHVLAGNPPLLPLVWRLPHLKQGWPTRVDRLHDELADSLAVEFSRPSRYMIDGEILTPLERLELSVGPRLAIVVGGAARG